MARAAELRARNAAFWEQAAPGWIRHAERQDDFGRPLGAAAIDRLRAMPGERILDVGCGCGGTTAELATAVGPTGVAVGVDLSEAMVAAAGQRFSQQPQFVAGAGKRLSRPEFVAGDIETMAAVPGAPFDAVYSRMTLMVLADPIAGLTAIARSLRPGGRLAASVFRDAASVPWLPAAVLGAAPHVGALPPLPLGDEPGPFAFADPARIRRILTAAGIGAVVIEPWDVTLEPPDEPDLVAGWLIEIGPAGAAYREATSQAQASARSGAVRLLERFRTPGVGYRFPAGIWLLTAELGG
ncbi:class I SAM-dependent methyltransferase [Actinoplanes auranticolor]|uniref:Methyltransferase n=1 Tax=Actinoplanes auranticolor TaxID=47988 RepID=A0A919VX36_9ACTN|nr:methyltransferase domain-containing protein [Actinoplanes auranticolor]GIM78987.1 methyltransferase [Actinoplanes auranticolor]